MRGTCNIEKATTERLWDIFHRLQARWGPQRWWPAEEPFEVIVGAILTQSAAWRNVEKAIANLKEAGALNPPALRQLPLERLAQLVYPAGYYNAKARKVKAFAQHLGERYSDALDKLFSLGLPRLRQELLSIHGIGEETADSIILYAAGKPVFVVDAYTRRIMHRLGHTSQREGYKAIQTLFMECLPQDEKLFNEYHALLVQQGKEVCRKIPLCHRCPLNPICPRFSLAGEAS